jgi:hypothetical protein
MLQVQGEGGSGPGPWITQFIQIPVIIFPHLIFIPLSCTLGFLFCPVDGRNRLLWGIDVCLQNIPEGHNLKNNCLECPETYIYAGVVGVSSFAVTVSLYEYVCMSFVSEWTHLC